MARSSIKAAVGSTLGICADFAEGAGSTLAVSLDVGGDSDKRCAVGINKQRVAGGDQSVGTPSSLTFLLQTLVYRNHGDV